MIEFLRLVKVISIILVGNHLGFGFKDERHLFALTCETRSGLWNLTSERLYEDPTMLIMNVCEGIGSWSRFGFLTKPLQYYQTLTRLNIVSTYNLSTLHVILTDSDTFWSVRDLHHLWENYDIVRQEKHLIVASEMGCWVGHHCNKSSIHRWYGDMRRVQVSSSPFLNSGVIMGRYSDVIKMLQYILTHNQSYFTAFDWRVWQPCQRLFFRDQLAVTDYAFSVAPDDVAIDYHQRFAASCFILRPTEYQDIVDSREVGHVCMKRDGSISFNCTVVNPNHFSDYNHIRFDSEHCLVHRTPGRSKGFYEDLALDPVIWHGNGKLFVNLSLFLSYHESGDEGVSKKLCSYFAKLSANCMLRRKKKLIRRDLD